VVMKCRKVRSKIKQCMLRGVYTYVISRHYLHGSTAISIPTFTITTISIMKLRRILRRKVTLKIRECDTQQMMPHAYTECLLCCESQLCLID
jgi:hypothetical protein